jgi:hypothetical protein
MAAERPNPLDEILKLLREIRDGITVEGLDPEYAARFCGVSLATWHEWDRRAMCPEPARPTDRLPRWSRTELLAWIRAGMPGRSRWALMRDVALRRAG